MFRRSVSIVQVLVVLALVARIQAAENPLDAVSTQAGFVIRLKAPKATIAKATELAEAVAPRHGNYVRNQLELLGALMSNPRFAGVDMESDWWLAGYPTGDHFDLALVWIIPATDLKLIRLAVGDGGRILEFGKHAIYTTSPAAAQQTVERLSKTVPAISTNIDREAMAVFESGVVSAFINIDRLVASNPSWLAETRKSLAESRGLASLLPLWYPPEFIAIAICQWILDTLVERIEAIRKCSVAAKIADDGVTIESVISIAAGTPADKILENSPPVSLSGLSLLPQRSTGYLGISGEMSRRFKINRLMLGLATATRAVPDVAKMPAGFIDDLDKLKFGEELSAFTLQKSEEGLFRSVTIDEVGHPDEAQKLSRSVFRAAKNIEVKESEQAEPDLDHAGKLTWSFVLKEAAEKYLDKSADLASITNELATGPSADYFAGVAFGAGGVTARSVYLKDRIVRTLGGGKLAMTEALAAIESHGNSRETERSFQRDRDRLLPKANIIVLFDLATLAQSYYKFMVGFSGDASVASPEKPLGQSLLKIASGPSYLGFAAAAEPHRVRLRGFIPLEQMQGLARFEQFTSDIEIAGEAEQKANAAREKDLKVRRRARSDMTRAAAQAQDPPADAKTIAARTNEPAPRRISDATIGLLFPVLQSAAAASQIGYPDVCPGFKPAPAIAFGLARAMTDEITVWRIEQQAVRELRATNKIQHIFTGLKKVDEDRLTYVRPEYGFPRRRVVSIEIANRDIEPGGLIPLERLQGLEHLAIGGFGMVAGGELARLSRISRLTSLTLEGELGDMELDCLRDLPMLQTLVLRSSTHIDAADVCTPDLRTFKSLRRVVISGAAVGANVLLNLSTLPHLDTAYITDGRFHAGDMISAKDLDAGGGEGGNAVRALSGVSSLRRLALNNSDLRDGDIQFLGAMPNLECLRFCNTPITDEGLKCLRSLKKLQYLDLSGPDTSARGLVHLREMPSLKSLSLYHRAFTEESVEVLANLPRLSGLQIVGSSLSKEAVPLSVHHIELLRRLPHLEALVLFASDITDAGIGQLVVLPRLKHLKLISCDKLTNAACAELLKLQNLESLELRNLTMTDEAMRVLCEHPKLRDLQLISSNSIGDKGVAYLRNLKNLESLRLSVRLTDQGLEALAEHPRLKRCTIAGGYKSGPTPAAFAKLSKGRQVSTQWNDTDHLIDELFELGWVYGFEGY